METYESLSKDKLSRLEMTKKSFFIFVMSDFLIVGDAAQKKFMIYEPSSSKDLQYHLEMINESFRPFVAGI